ncbi:MAG: hypothetical protein LUG18_00400 [Candidatus Azobacteroides sp.]|nr:hypothetical protein [Candidatus Azobacteroides sp.]
MKQFKAIGIIVFILSLTGCKEEYNSLQQENLKGQVKLIIVNSQQGDFYDNYSKRTEYHYNKDGYLIENKDIYTSFHSPNSSMDVKPEDLPYTLYNERGMITYNKENNYMEQHYDIEGNKSFNDKETYLYEKGLLVKHTTVSSTSTYTYKKGKLMQLSVVVNETNNEQEEEYDIEWGDVTFYYEYDKKGNLIAKTSEMGTIKYSYDQYDEMGNWISRKADIFDEQRGNEFLIETREIFYYTDEKLKSNSINTPAIPVEPTTPTNNNKIETIPSRESEEKEKQDKITLELLKIEKELRETVDKLAELQQQPMLSHGEILSINLQKQNIVRLFDNAIHLSQKAGDEQLVREYQIRKEQAVTAMQLMNR